MDEITKYKVLNWISDKLEKGVTLFDVTECTKDIGLNPYDKDDIETVDKVFQWNKQIIEKSMFNIFEGNN